MTKRTCLESLVAAALAGCGPAPPGETSATGTSSTGASSTGASAGATSAATTGGAETTGGSTSGGGATTGGATTGDVTTEGSSTGGETGGELCPPRDEPAVSVSWNLSFLDGPAPTEFSGPCTVEAATPKPKGGLVAFTCTIDGAKAQVEFQYTRAPEFPSPIFTPGEVYLLGYREEIPWWTDRWFTLRHEWGELLLAGIDADAVVPPGTTAEEFYGMKVALETGLCAVHDGPCGPLERGALALAPFGASVRVFDGTFKAIVDLAGDVPVWVETLTVEEAPICTDTPEVWARVLMQASFGP